MSIKMKDLIRKSQIIVQRYEQAKKIGDCGEMYNAVRDSQENLKQMEAERDKMDPGSREYNKACREIDRCRYENSDRAQECRQEAGFGQGKQDSIDKMEQKNWQLSQEMEKAIEKGDTARYDQLKSKYDQNVATQETMRKEAKEEGYTPRESIIPQKANGVNLDCDMRDKFAEKVQSGKNVTQQDRDNLEKYKQQAHEGLGEQIKYQNEMKIEGMIERGAHAQKDIDKLREENAKLIEEMDQAIEKCDTTRYDQLKSKYDQNVEKQEELRKDAYGAGYEVKDNINAQKSAGIALDSDMSCKLDRENAFKAGSGQPVTQQDRANVEKYQQRSEKGSEELQNYVNDRKNAEMRDRMAYGRVATGQAVEEQKQANKAQEEHFEKYGY